MADEYPFHCYELKYLPSGAVDELADILDTPYGGITMQRLAEEIDRLYGYSLGLNYAKTEAWKYAYGERPTRLLFDFLRKHGVSIGMVQYALDNMRASTSRIFRQYHDAIIGSYLHDARRSTSIPSENTCPDCNTGRESSVPTLRQYPTNQQSSLDQRDSVPVNPLRGAHNMQILQQASEGQMRLPIPSTPWLQNQSIHQQNLQRQSQISPRTQSQFGCSGESAERLPSGIRYSDRNSQTNTTMWIPPDSESCSECLRLQDPEETELLSPLSGEIHTCKTTDIRTNNLSRTTHSMSQHERSINNDVIEHNISYTENPSRSCDLRSAPDGISDRLSLDCKNNTTDKTVQKCTCKKPKTPTCTCKKSLKKQISVPASSTDIYNRTSTNRWSNPGPFPSSSLGSDSASVCSCSDPEISHQPHETNTGRQLFISFTDDVKQDVIELARQLKGQGHNVKTDLQRESFYLARERGLVSETNEYSWLSNMYHQSRFVIVCSSKGYVESLNMDDACPSSQYLNSKYIYHLMENDPQKHEKIIEVCFAKSLLTTTHRHCLNFAQHYTVPSHTEKLMHYLNMLI